MRTQLQRGAALLEFALVLPLFLVIILLTIDFGFLVYDKAVITNATREAARFGSMRSAAVWNKSDVVAVACNYVKTALISTKAGNFTSNCSVAGANPKIEVPVPANASAPVFGDQVVVKITYAYHGFFTSLNFLPGTFSWTMTAETTMLHE